MRRILAGIETEYGLSVEGRGTEEQVDDSMALVRAYPGQCHVGWNYRYESPRTDLRGFKLDRLAVDPNDARYDAGRNYGEAHEVRSDRILPNGARFYNDHGHPEYSTPECWGLKELSLHDCAGQLVVLRAAEALFEREGLQASLYKNNSDHHGASYGTHENYLVPRSLGFERLYAAVMPMLIVRQVLVGAGKVGKPGTRGAKFQLSQRADFFSEPANAETLYRRPIFNTRDEPHADREQWIRLHVISGDANMIRSATARKVGLVKIALALAELGEAPVWLVKDPVRTFQAISSDETLQFRIELQQRSWTDAEQVFESYFAAAERVLDLDEELIWVIESSRRLLSDLRLNYDRFRRDVDWAAKKQMLSDFVAQEGTNWLDPHLQAFDLEYHNIDREVGLFAALEEMAEVEASPTYKELEPVVGGPSGGSRAFARGLAVSRFNAQLSDVCWRTLTFNIEGRPVEVDLRPELDYPPTLEDANDVERFVEMLRGIQ